MVISAMRIYCEEIIPFNCVSFDVQTCIPNPDLNFFQQEFVISFFWVLKYTKNIDILMGFLVVF